MNNAVYTICKKRILKGGFVPTTMKETVEIFLAAGSITVEQYNELLELINAHQS